MTLQANLGSSDKFIRIVAGIILLTLGFFKLGGLTAFAGILAIVIGVVLLATGVINFCPAYKLLGLRTDKP